MPTKTTHILKITNETSYSTRALRSFFIRAFNAMTSGQWVEKRVRVVYSRRGMIWGCAHATEGLTPARWMMVSLPRAGSFSMEQLARVIRHEHAHQLGVLHREMDRDLMYCTGPTPEWAIGAQPIPHKIKPPKPKPTSAERQDVRYQKTLAAIEKLERRRGRLDARLRLLLQRALYYRRTLPAERLAALTPPKKTMPLKVAVGMYEARMKRAAAERPKTKKKGA